MTKRTAIYERSPESHWHWSWLFTCRKQTHFVIHKFNFFPPLLKHIWQSLWQYFQKQPVCHTWLYLTVPIFQKLLQTLQSMSVWQVAAAAGASRLIWDTELPQSTSQHVVCDCSLPHFTAGLHPCHSSVCQLLHPEISSMFSYQTFAHIYCFNIQRYCHLWSATGLDGKSSQNHKWDFIQSPWKCSLICISRR